MLKFLKAQMVSAHEVFFFAGPAVYGKLGFWIVRACQGPSANMSRKMRSPLRLGLVHRYHAGVCNFTPFPYASLLSGV